MTRIQRLAAIASVGFTTTILVAAQPPSPPPAGAVDLVSVEMGGRIESVTSQIDYVEWAPVNLIATTPYPGWHAENPELPQEIVVSFHGRQSALVGAVVVDAVTVDGVSTAKDVEIWSSTSSPTEGFVRVAASSLKQSGVEQPITFAPVEARFVRLRILSVHPWSSTGGSDPAPAGLARVRILEAERAGYVPLLTRNSDLASLARGVIPSAPPGALAPLPASGVSSCGAPPVKAKPPAHRESKRVLVIADTVKDYTPARLRSDMVVGSPVSPVDYSIYERLTFVHVTPRTASPAHLLPANGIDTVAISQVCAIGESVSAAFKQALMAWVATGHKLIIHDSDGCGGTTDLSSPNRPPDYSWLPFRMKTVNPGKAGLRGTASLLENNTIASGLSSDPAYLPLKAWMADEEGNGNELGDSNVITEHDPHWCGVIFGTNGLMKSGFIEAYARFGRGLIIYNGIDLEQVGSPAYNQLVTRELAQPFDPDHLPCSQPLGGFVITTDDIAKTQFAKAGATYTYPLRVLPNFGYTGRVALEARIAPADPGVSVSLRNPAVDLTKAAEAHATLTVTASPSASLKSKVITVGGRDTEGRTNVLCLNLSERTTGGLSVASGLRPDKPPTKNLEIILDASGSMKALLGKQTRWATAQAVLKDVVSKLPEDFSVGLRAYGHTLPSSDPETCTDTSLVVPVGPLDRAGLLAAARGLAPRGETPLVHSILQTPEDLKPVGGGTVILITDGEESCKGDFAAAAQALKDAGLNLTLNIVGFTLKNPPAQAALRGLAESTGGRYYSAQSGAALSRALLLAAVDRLPYRIVNAAGAEVAAGEAGVTGPHELPPGTYTLVVTAGDETLKAQVTVAVGQDETITVVIKDDKLVVG